MAFLMPAELEECEGFTLPTRPTYHVMPKLQNHPDFQISTVTWCHRLELFCFNQNQDIWDNPFF